MSQLYVREWLEEVYDAEFNCKMCKQSSAVKHGLLKEYCYARYRLRTLAIGESGWGTRGQGLFKYTYIGLA